VSSSCAAWPQGDNFIRNGGEYAAWQSLTVHSIGAHEKGLDVHMQVRSWALPSTRVSLYRRSSRTPTLAEPREQAPRLRSRSASSSGRPWAVGWLGSSSPAAQGANPAGAAALTPLARPSARCGHPLQANPSLAEMMYRQFKDKKEALEVRRKHVLACNCFVIAL
jgi:hypothetical protein